jgi:hypothetical protein
VKNEAMDGFELRVALKAEDVRTFAKAKRTPQEILLLIFLWLGFLLVYIVGVGVIYSLTQESWIGLLVMATAIYGLNKFFGRHKEEQYEKIANELVDYDLIVDRDGIVQKVGRTETKYAWEDLAVVDGRGEFLEMKMWDGAVILVPKHLFPNEEDFLASKSFIEERQKWVEAGHA